MQHEATAEVWVRDRLTGFWKHITDRPDAECAIDWVSAVTIEPWRIIVGTQRVAEGIAKKRLA